MVRASDGHLKTLLALYQAVNPHSMATEGVVSHYNRVKTHDRSSLNQATIKSILPMSLNGKGTTSFDTREAVETFLKRKERRNSQPAAALFRYRDYMKKFSGHLQAACNDSSYH